MFFIVLTLMVFNFTDFMNFSLMLNQFSSFQVQLESNLDKKSLFFFWVLMLIVLAIYFFKVYYLSLEKKINYFNFLFHWFVSSMIIVILSQNWIMMIIGWDMLGISSYLLIVFYNNMSSNNSGFSTMNTNRFGDMFLITFLVINMNTSMISFNSKWNEGVLFLMICLMTKSAQFPFSSWLPLAMAAPTPVSSLVHSSTLVTAGLFIIYKTDALFYNCMLLYLFTLSLWTNFYSGMMASLETDMKKMIALSTLSQISFMTLTLCMGMFYLSFLHLLTHAIFKASLFFWAGMSMHGAKSEQMFITFNAKSMKMSQSFMYLIFLSLIGVPISIGFYSKDQILDLMNNNYSVISNVLFSGCVFLTVFYTLRLMKKMNTMNFNKFNYKMSYFNIYQSNCAVLIFSFLLLSNKWINEVWFKTSFLIVTKGWKTFFLLMLAMFIFIGWKFNYMLKLSSLYKMVYLNFFTMKMMSKIINKNWKFNYFDFGWMDIMTMMTFKKGLNTSNMLVQSNHMMMILILLGMSASIMSAV